MPILLKISGLLLTGAGAFLVQNNPGDLRDNICSWDFVAPCPGWFDDAVVNQFVLLSLLAVSGLFFLSLIIPSLAKNYRQTVIDVARFSSLEKLPAEDSGPVYWSKFTNSELSDRIGDVSRGILEFLLDRHQHEPSSVPRKRSWNKDTNAIFSYSTETTALYHKKFGAQVVFLYEEAKARGFNDAELDRLYKYPTNALGIRDVGQRLGAVGHKIRSAG